MAKYQLKHIEDGDWRDPGLNGTIFCGDRLIGWYSWHNQDHKWHRLALKDGRQFEPPFARVDFLSADETFTAAAEAFLDQQLVDWPSPSAQWIKMAEGVAKSDTDETWIDFRTPNHVIFTENSRMTLLPFKIHTSDKQAPIYMIAPGQLTNWAGMIPVTAIERIHIAVSVCEAGKALGLKILTD